MTEKDSQPSRRDRNGSGRSLPGRRGGEREADLSALGDEGIAREAGRVVVRGMRDELKNRRVKDFMDLLEQRATIGLRVMGGLAAMAAVIAGLGGDHHLARYGLGLLAVFVLSALALRRPKG